jgi:hypothetical protein
MSSIILPRSLIVGGQKTRKQKSFTLILRPVFKLAPVDVPFAI